MSVDELKKIVEELKGASKMHAGQAKRIQAHIDEMEETTNEQKLNLFLEKNVPTDASKWSYYKSQAKKKFDVIHQLTLTLGQLKNIKLQVVVGRKAKYERSVKCCTTSCDSNC